MYAALHQINYSSKIKKKAEERLTLGENKRVVYIEMEL